MLTTFWHCATRFEKTSIVGSENEVADQPLPNAKPNTIKTLPPEATTLVVRNVLARLSPEKLLEVRPPNIQLVVCAFFKKKYRCGIALISMTSHEAAFYFIAKWHGHNIPNIDRTKCLTINAVGRQGFISNLLHLKSSNVARFQKEESVPLLFKGTRKLNAKALLVHVRNDDFHEDQMELFVSEPAVDSSQCFPYRGASLMI